MCCVILNYCLPGVHCCLHSALVWCVFSWVEHEVQHWQCVLSTAPPLDLAVMWLLMPHSRWMWGGPCLIVVCLCLTRVVDMLCVHAWPSVALECVCRHEFHPIAYTSVIGINYIYIMCVGCFFIAAIMFTDSHSHSPSDWTPFTPSFPPPLPLVTPPLGGPLVTPTQTHPLNPYIYTHVRIYTYYYTYIQ